LDHQFKGEPTALETMHLEYSAVAASRLPERSAFTAAVQRHVQLRVSHAVVFFSASYCSGKDNTA
jgi:hypothetical protein